MAEANPHHTLSETEVAHIAAQKAVNGHTITDVKIEGTTVNGNLGAYFRVELTIKEDGDEPRKHSLFMKSMPSECWKVDFLVNEGVFQKEVNFYKDISGLFRKYLSVDVCPRCFLADPGKIVLEDASREGYRPWRGITEEPLDYDHTKLGLEALARLHVGSIIYEEKSGRKVRDAFPDAAREVSFRPGSLGMDFLMTGACAVAALAPHLDTGLARDPDAVGLLQDHLGPWMAKLEQYVNEESPYRQVICHGDTWPANFLFRYDQQQKPISAMVIDFQMTRVRSPAFDVNMFLYLSALTDDVKNWRQGLLDAYYQVMHDEMRNCGLDPEKVFPKEEFLRACIHYQIVGLIFTLVYFPFVMVPLHVKDEATSTDDKADKFYFKDRSQYLIKWYKEYPMLRNCFNGVLDVLYHNFIKTQRGLTEFVS